MRLRPIPGLFVERAKILPATSGPDRWIVMVKGNGPGGIHTLEDEVQGRDEALDRLCDLLEQLYYPSSGKPGAHAGAEEPPARDP